MRHLYDAISTLANVAGGGLSPPQYVAALMPPLLAKWQSLAPADREQLPLLECIAQLVPAFGPAFEPYAGVLFQRCSALLQEQLALGAEGDADVSVSAFDALDALAEALPAQLASLASDGLLRELLLRGCQDSQAAVRQSAFALFGDLARAQPPQLLPPLQRSLELCCSQLQPESMNAEGMRASANACWAAGELLLRAPAEEMASLALPLTHVIAPLLSMRASASKGLLENAAIALGRLALRCPEPLAAHVQGFVEAWCVALRRVKDDLEKEQAFGGLCALVRLNPMAVWPALPSLAAAFASWRTLCDEALHRSMTEILRGYKAHLPAEQWEAGWQALEAPIRTKLQSWFLA